LGELLSLFRVDNERLFQSLLCWISWASRSAFVTDALERVYGKKPEAQNLFSTPAFAVAGNENMASLAILTLLK
jgi:hypothetical protein